MDDGANLPFRIMAETLKDLIVSIGVRQSARLETWLLARGHSINQSATSADGSTRFYSVRQVSEVERNHLTLVGGSIVSQWSHGERQRAAS